MRIYHRQTLRKSLGIPLEAPVLLSVGEVNVNKNHKVVIESMPALSGSYYVVCGRGPLMETHIESAQKFGVSDRVIFTGYRTDVANFYKMTDIFVFPSLREGLPVSVMEAMASGMPVICSQIRGNSDLIVEGYGGIFFDPADQQDLQNKLNAVLKNPKSWRVMGHFNEEKSKKFELTNVLLKMQDLYLRREVNTGDK